jgi:hypothetical protein
MSLTSEEKRAKDREYYRVYMTLPGKRERSRELAKKNYAKNKESRREWRKKHRAKIAECARQSLERNPERKRAIDLAQRHVPLAKKCEMCEATKNLERHHDDYSKPLEVKTMCKQCHEAYHRTHKPKSERSLFVLTCAFCGAVKEVPTVPLSNRFRCNICLKITKIDSTKKEKTT